MTRKLARLAGILTAMLAFGLAPVVKDNASTVPQQFDGQVLLADEYGPTGKP